MLCCGVQITEQAYRITAMFIDHSSSNTVGHVNNIPTMQFFTGSSRYTQSKLYMLSLTEWVWDFQNDALWDTH